MTGQRKRWFRDDYVEAVWETEVLRPHEILVALAYARHAGDSDVSWVTWSRLSRWTGIRSKDALSRAIRGLEKAGWLVLLEARKQHRSPRYRLVIPDQSEVRGADVCEGSEVREADHSEPPEVRETDVWVSPEVRETTARGTRDGARGTPRVPDNSSLKNSYEVEPQPVAPHQVVPQPQEVGRSRDHWKAMARDAVHGKPIDEPPFDPYDDIDVPPDEASA